MAAEPPVVFQNIAEFQAWLRMVEVRAKDAKSMDQAILDADAYIHAGRKRVPAVLLSAGDSGKTNTRQ